MVRRLVAAAMLFTECVGVSCKPYPMPSLYFWMSFCLSSLSSTQYSLGMTKLDVIRHSGQDLRQKIKNVCFDPVSYLLGSLSDNIKWL